MCSKLFSKLEINDMGMDLITWQSMAAKVPNYYIAEYIERLFFLWRL